MRRLAFVVAGVVVAVCAAPGQASAVELQAAGTTGWSAGSDASMCFTVGTAGPAAGAATATGLVRTDRPLPSLDSDGADVYPTPPTTLVAHVRPLASLTGIWSVCVGGAGARAIGGTVVFTVDVQGATDDFVTVVACTYSLAGPACG